MNIEQKLEYLRKALEAGAYIDVRFHNMHSKKEAESLAVECSKMLNQPITHSSAEFVQWFKINDGYAFKTSIYFDYEEVKV